MKKIVCILSLFLYAFLDNRASAQDPAFSQFFASPLTLNPALTGKFNGVVRVAGNYRNQWPAINNAFITSTISVDGGILKNKLPETDTWGLGLMAMTDKTANGILASNYISLSTAYHKSLDENGWNQIGIGFQGTYANKRLDGTKLNFEDELDQQGGWTIPSAETIDGHQVNLNYFDMNVGILYNGSSNGDNNFYLGASMYHITRPKESFTGNAFYVLHPRVTVHGGYSFPLSPNSTTNYLHFSGLFSKQANATDAMLGGAWSVNVNNNDAAPINFYAGAWLRFSNLTDAVIPYIGLDFSNFTLGLSYDVNVSSLKTASQSMGGIEISLIYIKKPADGRKGVPCPKF
ncbi:MAG: PorP/SprF family type IX secretion system membrane protein [Bacteroidetes bacterium]|nr:PorP/SprF family type IX secretion system membrane protein [Bacteroidota bacterium]